MADTLQFQNQFDPIVRALSRRQQLPVFKANERTIGNRVIEIFPHTHILFVMTSIIKKTHLNIEIAKPV